MYFQIGTTQNSWETKIKIGEGEGDNTKMVFNPTGGNVGNGVVNPQNTLDVNGTIHAKEIKVDLIGWSDFVFNDNYKLRELEELEDFIMENKHLPDIPSEEEVLKSGVQLGEMNALLLQKIEELTLYIIEQDKKTEKLNRKVHALETRIEQAEK